MDLECILKVESGEEGKEKGKHVFHSHLPMACGLLKAGTASVTSVTLSGARSTGVSLKHPQASLPLLVLPWPLAGEPGVILSHLPVCTQRCSNPPLPHLPPKML